MSEQSSTPNLLELARPAFEPMARRDVDALVSFGLKEVHEADDRAVVVVPILTWRG